MKDTVRRVVTGNDTNGRAFIASDEELPFREGARGAGGPRVCNLWMTDGMPPTLTGPDPCRDGLPMLPVKDGVTFRFMELPPGCRPCMHRTETLDYVIVFEGELEMYLDDGERVHMKEGDILIQRGTMHGWANPFDRPCRFATVIIDQGGRLFEAGN